MIRHCTPKASALVVSLALLAAQAEPAPTQPSAAARSSAPPGYTMPFTHMWDMKSDAGETYRIFVSYPAGEAPANGYPVLYVLDGNASFAAFAEARRIQEYEDVGKAIIVGVGYPTDKAYDLRRLNDYTPPLLNPAPTKWRELAKYKSGGREAFLDFLTGKLRTEISKRYKIDLERQSLFGHSLGGLFGMHTLFSRPGAFQAIVTASPSIEWNDQEVLREEQDFASRLKGGKVDKPSRLMVVVGLRDTDDDPYVGQAFARRMDLLSGYGLRTRLVSYEDEVHISVPSRSVTDVLRFVFETP